MKKIFTLFLFLLATAWAMAQDSNTFQFVDKDGNVIADGTTVTVNTPVSDDFGGTMMPSGLFVKNTSAENAGIRMAYQVESIDNGDFQLCFPVNCIRKMEAGSYRTESGKMNAGEIRDLQCEWFPVEFGCCKAKLTIEIMDAMGAKTADGPFVTIVFNYAAPAGIGHVDASNAPVCHRFNLQGQAIDQGCKGVCIVRLSNGKMIKCFTK